MRIAYISNSIIPSRTANSIHIMKMCSAFVMNGNEVFLIIPDRLSETELDVTDEFDFYGVKKNFKIIKVPVYSTKELAQAIEKLILNKELLIQMGNRSRHKAENEFNVDNVINTHLKIYNNINKV